MPYRTIVRPKPLYADCGSARPVRRSFRIRINKLTFFPISDRQKRFHTQRLRRGSQSPALPVLAFLQLLVFFGCFSYCNYYYIPRKKFVNRFSPKFKKTLRQEKKRLAIISLNKGYSSSFGYTLFPYPHKTKPLLLSPLGWISPMKRGKCREATKGARSVGRVAFANEMSKRRERSCILKHYERSLLFAFATSIDGFAATFPKGESEKKKNETT